MAPRGCQTSNSPAWDLEVGGNPVFARLDYVHKLILRGHIELQLALGSGFLSPSRLRLALPTPPGKVRMNVGEDPKDPMRMWIELEYPLPLPMSSLSIILDTRNGLLLDAGMGPRDIFLEWQGFKEDLRWNLYRNPAEKEKAIAEIADTLKELTPWFEEAARSY